MTGHLRNRIRTERRLSNIGKRILIRISVGLPAQNARAVTATAAAPRARAEALLTVSASSVRRSKGLEANSWELKAVVLSFSS